MSKDKPSGGDGKRTMDIMETGRWFADKLLYVYGLDGRREALEALRGFATSENWSPVARAAAAELLRVVESAGSTEETHRLAVKLAEVHKEDEERRTLGAAVRCPSVADVAAAPSGQPWSISPRAAVLATCRAAGIDAPAPACDAARPAVVHSCENCGANALGCDDCAECIRFGRGLPHWRPIAAPAGAARFKPSPGTVVEQVNKDPSRTGKGVTSSGMADRIAAALDNLDRVTRTTTAITPAPETVGAVGAIFMGVEVQADCLLTVRLMNVPASMLDVMRPGDWVEVRKLAKDGGAA